MSYTVDIQKIAMPLCWKKHLCSEFSKEYFKNIKKLYMEALERGENIYPAGKDIFKAFSVTPFDTVRVIILGQDPYHGEGQAMGLSFSVPKGVKVPPSLQNIYKEIERSMGIPRPQHGDLTYWAKQGVFLLNTSLTVAKNSPSSHKHWGWTQFTDAVIRVVSEQKEHCVFMLWGNHAKAKKVLIDSTKHTALESVHPSPLAGGAFIGNNHFLLANEALKQYGYRTIDWDSANEEI